MSFGGGFTAAAAKVVLGVENSQLNAGLAESEARVVQATAAMGGATAELAERQLRAANAQDYYNRQVQKFGPYAYEARTALAALASEQRKVADLQNVSTTSMARFERGMLAGSARGLGFGRALMFASNAFLGGAGLIYALHGAIKASADFNKEMTLISTQALAGMGEVKRMTSAVKELSGPLATGPIELSKGLYRIESAGNRGAAALKLLTTAAKGAKLGYSDLESTATALIAADKAQIRLARSTDYTDGSLRKLHATMAIVDAIVGAGNMRMEDLTSALESGVIPAAKQFGITFQELGAALDTLTVQGQPAELSATRLRYTISLLGAQTPKAEKELRQLGISATEVGKTMRTQGLVPALDLLKSKLTESGLSIEEQNRILVRAYGGGRSSTTILALLQHLDLLKNKLHEIQTQGTPEKFGERFAETTRTAAFAFSRIAADIETTKINLGAAISQPFVHGADSISHWLEAGKNQKRVSHDVVQGFHEAEAAARVFGTGIHQLADVMHLFDDALGGSGQSLKLLLELLVLSKLTQFARGIGAHLLTPLRQVKVEADAAERAVASLTGKGTGPGMVIGGGSVMADQLDEEEMLARQAATSAGIPAWRAVGSAAYLQEKARQQHEQELHDREAADKQALQEETRANSEQAKLERSRNARMRAAAEQAKLAGKDFNAAGYAAAQGWDATAAAVTGAAGAETRALEGLALAEQGVDEATPAANVEPYEAETAAIREEIAALENLTTAKDAAGAPLVPAARRNNVIATNLTPYAGLNLGESLDKSKERIELAKREAERTRIARTGGSSVGGTVGERDIYRQKRWILRNGQLHYLPPLPGGAGTTQRPSMPYEPAPLYLGNTTEKDARLGGSRSFRQQVMQQQREYVHQQRYRSDLGYRSNYLQTVLANETEDVAAQQKSYEAAQRKLERAEKTLSDKRSALRAQSTISASARADAEASAAYLAQRKEESSLLRRRKPYRDATGTLVYPSRIRAEDNLVGFRGQPLQGIAPGERKALEEEAAAKERAARASERQTAAIQREVDKRTANVGALKQETNGLFQAYSAASQQKAGTEKQIRSTTAQIQTEQKLTQARQQAYDLQYAAANKTVTLQGQERAYTESLTAEARAAELDAQMNRELVTSRAIGTQIAQERELGRVIEDQVTVLRKGQQASGYSLPVRSGLSGGGASRGLLSRLPGVNPAIKRAEDSYLGALGSVTDATGAEAAAREKLTETYLTKGVAAEAAYIAATESTTVAQGMMARSLTAASSGIAGLGRSFGGPNGPQRAMGIGLLATLFGNQANRTGIPGLGSIVTGAGSGLLFGSMLGAKATLPGAAIGAAFGIRHVVGGRSGSLRGDIGRTLGYAGEGAALGAAAGVAGGPFTPITVPVGAGVGAALGGALGLGSALFRTSHSADRAAEAFGRLTGAVLHQRETISQLRTERGQIYTQLTNDRVARDQAKGSLEQAKAEEKATRGTKQHQAALDSLRAAQANYDQSVKQVKTDLAALSTQDNKIELQRKRGITQNEAFAKTFRDLAHDARTPYKSLEDIYKAGGLVTNRFNQLRGSGLSFHQAMAQLNREFRGGGTALRRYVAQLNDYAAANAKSHPKVAALARAVGQLATALHRIPKTKVVNLIVNAEATGDWSKVLLALALEGKTLTDVPGLAKLAGDVTKGAPHINQAYIDAHRHKHGGAGGTGKKGPRPHGFLDPTADPVWNNLETRRMAAETFGNKRELHKVLLEEKTYLLNTLRHANNNGQKQEIYGLLQQVNSELSSLGYGSGSSGGGGSSLIPPDLQSAYDKAYGSGNKQKQLTALEKEAAYLKRYLAKPGLSPRDRRKAEHELGLVEHKIHGLERATGSTSQGDIIPPRLQIEYQQALQGTYGGKGNRDELERQRKIVVEYLKEGGHSKSEREAARKQLAMLNREIKAGQKGGGWPAVIAVLNKEAAYLEHYIHDEHHTLKQRLAANKELTKILKDRAAAEKKLNGGLGGSDLLPIPLQIAYEQARRTKTSKDDIKALQAEENWLKRYLERKDLRPQERLKAEKLLSTIDGKLQKLVDGQNKQLKAAEQHFLSEQASFWSTFAPNIFHDSANGRQVGSGSGQNIDIGPVGPDGRPVSPGGGYYGRRGLEVVKSRSGLAGLQQRLEDHGRGVRHDTSILERLHQGQHRAEKQRSSILKAIEKLDHRQTKRGITVIVNQHFPHAPSKDGHREARVARQAMAAAFD